MSRVPPGPVPWLPEAVARAASRIYTWEVDRRSRAYDRGTGVTTLDIPVVSIGNLSVGGTGKTPMVEHMVRTLVDAGRRPCIAMRGYRSRGGVSDEAEEYRDGLAGLVPGPGLPIVAQPDRIAGIREAAKHATFDCVVLDDGFQHRKIARACDIVLADATRPFTADAPLPCGWLREPIRSLSRATAIVVTRADLSEDAGHSLMEASHRAHPSAILASCALEWTQLRVVGVDGHSRRENIHWLRGKPVVACSAIGNPAAFLHRLSREVGEPLMGTLTLRDHDPYAQAAASRLLELARSKHAETVVVTRKDWMKMRSRQWPFEVAYPIVGVRWLDEPAGRAIEEHVLAACSTT